MLESEGLITVQRGKVGGAIVHRPSYTDAASTMALVLRSHDTEIADVAVSLAVLERQCAVLCARRPDRDAHRRARAPGAERDGAEPRATPTSSPSPRR